MKLIYQFDLQGNLLKRWRSISDAAILFSNNKKALILINNCCQKIINQAFGYYWSFKNKFEFKVNNNITPVAQYSDEGKFIESYSNIYEAAEENNIKNPFNIISVIQGYQKHCGGFRWRYFYGNTDNIKSL